MLSDTPERDMLDEMYADLVSRIDIELAAFEESNSPHVPGWFWERYDPVVRQINEQQRRASIEKMQLVKQDTSK